MNMYLVILLVVGLAVVISCVWRGGKKGFVYEVNAMLTVICATICFNIIAGIIRRQNMEGISSLLMGILMFVIVMALYGIFHFIFKALHIFARLPLIRIVDSVLGVAAGLVEGALTLYLFDNVLRFFVGL